jgi:hypothetical protein
MTTMREDRASFAIASRTGGHPGLAQSVDVALKNAHSALREVERSARP